MGTRLFLSVFAIAFASCCYADDNDITDIADGITSYRLSAEFCHWPIPSNIDAVLKSDESHFSAKSPKAFSLGVTNGADRFKFLSKSTPDYCSEIKESRDEMTQSLKARVK